VDAFDGTCRIALRYRKLVKVLEAKVLSSVE